MLSYLFDILFVLIVVAVAYLVARNSMVHSVAASIAVLVASLLAITNFEPLSNWINRTFLLPSDFQIRLHLDFFVAIGVFASTLAILLWCVYSILPDAPNLPPRIERMGRWVCGALTGYLFAAFLLTALLTFPAPREYWGALAPEAHRRPGPIMACAPDYQFLAFTEFTCEHAFAFTGGAWLLDRPVISADATGGRWSSFPIRYALWREGYEGRNKSLRFRHQLNAAPLPEPRQP